ncbi:hypothetical protein GCM10007884_21540 [Methylobacterium brachythecii]|uniref:Flagellar hook-length control protein FliK n=1 Tax=Methylobacterium brachythecii TaxID=1176177 RepID=A0ABQ6D1F5_9HYPH|nr:hypothetical protein [Methylobacterium brachythecii]GLS44167.1 hypothetical protein GCM10007884_21540 [Methylobacterium brachythecii]
MSAPAAAEEPSAGAGIIELPFKVKAMRGPGSEVSLAVSTSGILPIARPKPASADPKAPRAPAPDETEVAPVAVVWGDDGGAVLSLDGDAVKTTLIGAEAIEGLFASETPRGAVPGSRRALSGPLSAYLTGAVGGAGQAAGLTLRERQPLGTTSEPKAVPVATVTLAPGADQAFAARRPRIAILDGKAAVLVVTAGPGAASALALAEKDAGGAWTLAARTPPQAGATALSLAGVGDFSGKGRPQFVSIREPDAVGTLQLWSYAGGAFGLVAEAPGYAGPTADIDLAAVIPGEPGKAAALALPASDRTTLAIVSLDGGIVERARILLPGPAALGIAVLGRGERARVLVGLADGRLAVAGASAGAGVRP